MVENNRIDEAKEITKEIEFINTTLLLSQGKSWIENENEQRLNDVFSCRNHNDLISEFLFLISNLYSSQKDFKASNFYLNLSSYLNPKFTFNLSLVSENYFLNEEYEKAKAELLIAELNLKRCKILAPFDGAVEEIIVNTYETIQPQVELMKIIQTDVLELEMVVSSEWVSWLTIGHPIVVFIDEIKKEFNATVSGIGANVDPVSQTIQLKGTIIDVSPALLAGMSGRVIF